MNPVESINQLDGSGFGTVVSDHFIEGDNYRAYRPHGMRDSLLTFTLAGEGYFRTDAGQFVSPAGTLAILKAGTPHRYGTVHGTTWDFIWVHFNPQDIEPNLIPQDGLSLLSFDTETTRARISHAFHRILADSKNQDVYWHELCISAIKEILLLVVRRSRRVVDSRVEETLHLLSREMKEPLRIEAIAKKIGLSASRLSYVFKQNTGITMIEALNDIRIRQAARLLESTDRIAAEVADDVGFHNYNHFIHQFRKRYGVSPSVFAKAHREKTSPPLSDFT